MNAETGIKALDPDGTLTNAHHIEGTGGFQRNRVIFVGETMGGSALA